MNQQLKTQTRINNTSAISSLNNNLVRYYIRNEVFNSNRVSSFIRYLKHLKTAMIRLCKLYTFKVNIIM